MKLHETKLDDSPRKPFSEMDESELRATAGALDHRIHELANLFGEYRAISNQRQKAYAILRDRFGIDPKTGRKVRKVRNLLDLTG